MFKKIFATLLLLAALAGPALSQNANLPDDTYAAPDVPGLGYQDTIQVGQRDNPADCVNISCWTSMMAAPLTGILSIAVSPSGNLFAVGSDHNVYNYNVSSHMWTDISGPLAGLAKGVTIGCDTVGCGSTAYVITSEADNVYFLLHQNSNQWYKLTGGGDCNIQIAAAQNNQLWCIAGGYVFRYNYTSLVWTENTPSSVSMASIAVDKDGDVVGWGTDGNLWLFNGTVWVNRGHTLGFTPRTSPQTIAMASDKTVGIIDNTNGIHISRDGGQTFTKVTGSATLITATSKNSLFVGQLLGVWHYNGTMPMLTSGFTGVEPCFTRGGPCPPGSQHESFTKINFPAGLAGVGSDVLFNPSLTPPNHSVDYTLHCDPYYYADQSGCKAHYQGWAICPNMGNLFDFDDDTPFFDIAILTQKYRYIATVGPAYTYFFTGRKVYTYSVMHMCLNGPPHPLLTTIDDTYPGPYWSVLLWIGTAGGIDVSGDIAMNTGDMTLVTCQSIP